MAERVYRLATVELGNVRLLDVTFKRSDVTRYRPFLDKLRLHVIPQASISGERRALFGFAGKVSGLKEIVQGLNGSGDSVA